MGQSLSSGGGLTLAMAGTARPMDGTAAPTCATLLRQLFERHGSGLVNHCEGQFAAVVADERSGRLEVTLLVNWPGGPFTLYYALRGGRLVVAVVALVIYPTLGPDECGLPGERTLVRGVRRVVPGFAVRWRPGGSLEVVQAVRLPLAASVAGDAQTLLVEHREALGRILQEAPEAGVLLSGGVDSSLNLALATELAARPLDAFTGSFAEDEFDESAQAALTAAALGARHHVVKLEADCLDRLPEMVWAMQEPIIDYSFVPSFMVAEYARAHVGSVIAGDGPDHLLGRRFGPATWCDLLGRLPLGRRAAEALSCEGPGVLGWRKSLWRAVRQTHRGRQFWLALACGVDPSGYGLQQAMASKLWGPLAPVDFRRVLQPDLLSRTSPLPLGQIVARLDHDAQSPLAQFCVADASLCGLSGVLVKAGRAAAGCDLAIHEPYLTRRVAMHMLSLDSRWKVQASLVRRLVNAVPSRQTKLALRALHVGRVPPAVAAARKRGFEPPLAVWFRRRLAGLRARDLCGSLLTGGDWLCPRYLDGLIERHVQGRGDHTFLLWLLACLDQWHRLFIARPPTRPDWRWPECFISR